MNTTQIVVLFIGLVIIQFLCFIGVIWYVDKRFVEIINRIDILETKFLLLRDMVYHDRSTEHSDEIDKIEALRKGKLWEK